MEKETKHKKLSSKKPSTKKKADIKNADTKKLHVVKQSEAKTSKTKNTPTAKKHEEKKSEPKKTTNNKKKTTSKRITKKQIGKTILNVLGLLVWTGISIIIAQLVVELVMLSIITLSNGGGIFTFSGTDVEKAAIETINEPVWATVFSAFSYVAAMILIIWGAPEIIKLWRRIQTKRGKKVKYTEPVRVSSREELGLRDLPTWADIGLGPVGFCAYILLAAGLMAIFTMFPGFDVEQQQNIGFNFGLIGMDRLLAFLTLVVVAPIAEEIIFRGWLYDKLRRRLSTQMSNVWGMILSIFLVSLLFAAIHRQLNVGVNVFAMSIVMCGLREITGTIYASIFLHIIKNGFAFYLLFVLGIG